MSDLARLTGIPGRTIRSYIEAGLLPKPRFASNATAYSRETLGLLGVIRRARDEHRMTLTGIKPKLRAMTPEQVEEWAEELDPTSQASEGVEAPAPVRTSAAPAPAAPLPLDASERWLRVALIPGLELMMREGSGELVARLAREIQTKYRVTP
jgi:DNA-binding transcriptional MerR regulator